MQAQIQALLAAVVPKPNTRSSTKVAKLQVFDETVGNFLRFLTVCKLFIRINMRGHVVEEQI